MIRPDSGFADVIVPLHVRSGYSLLRGTAGLDKLLHRAAELGHARLALTDFNSLGGATYFWKSATDAGIQPLLGAELHDKTHAAIAMVRDDVGYENLCCLITRMMRGEEDDAPSPDLPAALSELHNGLELIVEDVPLAEGLLRKGIPCKTLWLGVDPPSQNYARLRELIDAGERLGLPFVATGKALASGRDEQDAARLLAAIRTGANYNGVASDELPPSGAVLRSAARLHRELSDLPATIRNNAILAERCESFRLLPREPVFPDFPCSQGKPPSVYLRQLCEQGIVRRYGRANEVIRRRLERELSLIERLGFCEYFLVVWDIVQYARRQRAPVAGRGSGASSIVAYLLEITNVCPIAYEIPFERFLHEHREDFPDLDVDFCWRIRDDVIDYAFRRWGRERVAMVSSHICFQPRSALRETAKAFGLSNEQISRLVDAGELSIQSSGQDERRLGDLPTALSRQVLSLSRQILDLPHVLSVHPGGIVIAPRGIERYVPVQQAAKGVRITQYDKNGVEDIALVKLDLLGNRNLSTVRFACDLIERHRDEHVDVEAIPPDDPPTIRMLQSGDTVGCNQLESPAMRHLLKMMRPDHVRQVMKVLALIRPGAANIGMKETFVRRHRGLDAVPEIPPPLHATLESAYGVMLYEDDVMLAAAALLGVGHGEADRFRRAVTQCRSDARRLELSREFIARCISNGIDRAFAEAMWVQMAKFNAYSFCRAHAASYAQLSYAGAYLKRHYPREFWTAALNNNQSMYPHRVYVEQAKRADVRFVLPEVNRSGPEFEIDDSAIRVGLGCVGGLGPVACKRILDERDRGGSYAGLTDLLVRTHIGETAARSLIRCGAFDAFERPRPALMMELNLVCRLPKAPGSTGTLLPASTAVPAPPGDYPCPRKYFDERAILGFSVREHIMQTMRPPLEGLTDADSRDIPSARGQRVRLAGVLEAYRTTRTDKGEPMMFLTMDDEYGLFEVTMFSDLCRRMRLNPSCYGPYVVTGRVEDQYDSLSVTAESVKFVGHSSETAMVI